MPTVFSKLPSSLHIGVIRGGPSREYNHSLLSGGQVLDSLRDTHKPIDIFISRDGTWHMGGVERSPERILKNVDVVWNAIHGEYGEDGQVQEILNLYGIPYTGSERYASSIALNKSATKERVKAFGVKTPLSSFIRSEDFAPNKVKEIISSIPYPLIIKPVTGGGAMGAHVATTPQELLQGIEEILTSGSGALIEEYISGKEASCGIIDNFRGEKLYSLPPVEIISDQDLIICPGNFSAEEKREIETLSALVHGELGLGHYSKSDFIVTPRRGIYFLEINTLPKFGDKSVLAKSLESVGISIKEFVHHLLALALNK